LFGKPADRADGVRMLRALSARTHRVLTAVALAHARGVDSVVSISEVTFGDISVADGERYWATGEPLDKAGGYAVQGLGALFIRHISGSYSGIMGLPLYETGTLLARAGVGHALTTVVA
jgi:septum formation protein